MKRQFRRSLRKIERKFSQAKSYTIGLVRSNSHYNYSTSSPPPIPSRSIYPANSSDEEDDDLVFGPTLPTESSVEDSRRPSTTLIPCEFCQAQQPSNLLTRHELQCLENPNAGRVRRHNRLHANSVRRRRRAVSDSASPRPSAPPRSRSPSLTDDVNVPKHLVCPITGSIFHDPVVASDGHTYEREAISHWLSLNRCSPITRESISVDKLNPNLIIKNMVDEFRTECRQKKSVYKYKLDVDVKKSDEAPLKQTNTQTIYRAEWIKKPSLSTNPHIYLIYLTGESAKPVAEIRCRNLAHPNLVRTFGRVEHKDPDILLLQEAQPDETLTSLIDHSGQSLSINIYHKILYQILSILEYLTKSEINYGNITTDDILIDHFDNEEQKDISIKLVNIGDIEKRKSDSDSGSETTTNSNHIEKSNIYAFGEFAKELYLLSVEVDGESMEEREILIGRCLINETSERPSFTELKEAFSKFTDEDKGKSDV